MESAFFRRALVVVRGGGDLASGAIHRLHRAGFPVAVLELPQPTFVRRAVCFGEAVYSGQISIEGVVARRAAAPEEALRLVHQGEVPVLVDAVGDSLARLQPPVLIDARMAKINLGTTKNDAPLVITLGPGFTAGLDCHAVIETNRGHNLGKVIWLGQPEPDTGEPGAMEGKTHSRVLRAPAIGSVQPTAEIGDALEAGQLIASVDGHAVRAPFTGILRGLIHPEVVVRPNMKIGDIDPRLRREACFTISDKSRAVGGGVLEAILASPQIRATLMMQTDHETSESL